MIGLTRFIIIYRVIIFLIYMERQRLSFDCYNEKKNLRNAKKYLQNFTFIRNNSYLSTRFHVSRGEFKKNIKKKNRKIKRGRNFQINNFEFRTIRCQRDVKTRRQKRL